MQFSTFNLAALHKEGAYTHLMNEEDVENLKWLKIFKYVYVLTSIATYLCTSLATTVYITFNVILYSKYDLYSKSKVQVDIEKVKPYYLSLIKKVMLNLNNLNDLVKMFFLSYCFYIYDA